MQGFMLRINFKTIDFKLFVAFLIVLMIVTIAAAIWNNHPNPVIRFLLLTKGNTIGVIIGSFFFTSLQDHNSLKRRIMIVGAVVTGLIIYEFMQRVIPWQTYDPNDILGSLAGGIIAIIINIVIVLSIRKKIPG